MQSNSDLSTDLSVQDELSPGSVISSKLLGSRISELADDGSGVR